MITASLKKLRRSVLARNTAWMTVAQGGRLLIQGVYFVIIGRTLGAQGFGLFAGAAALVATLVPFAGWGSGNVMIRRVAVDRACFGAYWGNALTLIIAGSGLFILISAGISAWVFTEIPTVLILLVALSDLVFGRVLETAAQAFQAFERLDVTAMLNLSHGGLRLIGAVIFSLGHGSQNAVDWAFWYFGATVVMSVIAFGLVSLKLGKPRPDAGLLREQLREGWHFAIGLASSTVYSDLDKTLLTQFGTPGDAGVYSAAYRGLTLAFAPVRSLLYASYTRFFQRGVDGITGSLVVARRLLPFAVIYGFIASLGIFLLAPLAPLILGSEYIDTVVVLKWLAAVPLLQSLHYFAADTLTGAGHQNLRSSISVFIAGANTVGNLWLIPLLSWRGAAVTTLATEGGLALVLWAVVGYKVMAERE